MKTKATVTPKAVNEPTQNLQFIWSMIILGAVIVASGIWLSISSFERTSEPTVEGYVVTVIESGSVVAFFVGVGTILAGAALTTVFLFKIAEVFSILVISFTLAGLMPLFVFNFGVPLPLSGMASAFCVSAHGSEAEATRDGEKVECSLVNNETKQVDTFAYQMKNETSETDDGNTKVYRVYPVNAQPGL